MASTFALATAGSVTPENKGGPRVGIGCKVIATRDSDGALIIQVWRGAIGGGGIFDVVVRTKMVAATAATEVLLQLGCMDLGLDSFDDRAYQMEVVADGGATLIVREGFIATEPYAPAGSGP